MAIIATTVLQETKPGDWAAVEIMDIIIYSLKSSVIQGRSHRGEGGGGLGGGGLQPPQ